MRRSVRAALRDTLPAALVALIPVAAVAAWTAWVLRQVDAIERAIKPLGGLAYATFVQLAHNWAEGAGWVQTVHRGYAEDWRWGGHYAPVLFVSSWLASFSDSPWALARVQVVAVGLGGLAAWKLGRAEAGLPGGAVGLALYLGSGPAVLLALADYQDLVFVVPLLPLTVWAARHASAPVFVACAAALGAAREEALLLLPVVGLAGGVPRALVGAAVTGVYLALYRSLGAPPYPNPLGDILGFQVSRAREVGTGALVSLSPNLYGAMAGAGWPWLVLAPIVALPAAAVALFHAQDPTAVATVGSPAIHHLAPLAAAAIAAGIVGACRLMRLGRVATAITLAGVAAATFHSWSAWQAPLLEHALRGGRGEAHPAWALLDKADPAAPILVPEALAPAAARRRYAVTRDSLGDRVQAADIRYALDDGGIRGGTVVAQEGRWRLVEDPPIVATQPAHGAAAPTPGTVLGRQ